MATVQDAAKQSLLSFSEEDTSYILTNLNKMNNMLLEYPSQTQLVQDSDGCLRVSHRSQQEYQLTLRILGRHFQMKFNRSLTEQSEPVTALIELDQCTHQYVKANIDTLNQTLASELYRVSISLSEGCDLQITGKDTRDIEVAFRFLRSQLESLYNDNIPPQSQPNDPQYQSSTSHSMDPNIRPSQLDLPHQSQPNDPQYQTGTDPQYQYNTDPTSHSIDPSPLQSSHSSQDSMDFCLKKWIIPDTLFDACQSKIDSIFRQHDCAYYIQYTATQNVIIEYEGSSRSIELIKAELETLRQQYTALNPPTGAHSKYSDELLDSQSHFSYQEELASPPPTPPSPPVSTVSTVSTVPIIPMIPTVDSEMPELDQTAQLEFIQPISLQQTNPFYFDLHPSVARRDGMSHSPAAEQAMQPAITNPVLNNFSQTPVPEPIHVTRSPVDIPLPNESDYSRTYDPNINTNQFQSNPHYPAKEQSYSNPQTPASGKSKVKTKENSLIEAMRGKPYTQPLVSTSSFNDPQLVTGIASTSLDTSKQQQQQRNIPGSDPQEDRFSHQSLDAIIPFGDKFASVVTLPSDGSYQEARKLENTLIGLRVVQCPTRPRVCTVVADEKELLVYALKSLNKKFGQLGYLPGCNGIPVTSQGTSCFVELDDKPSESKSARLLASLSCGSGLSIKIKSMNFNDGKWDAVVKSVEPNAISSTRLEYAEILEVVGPGITPAQGRYMADKADRLDYWCFYDSKSKEKFCRHILRLVIPGWNPNDFKANNLKDSIVSILRYCNGMGFTAIAFPIIGHESKHIPIPLSAQALLRAIDEFSSRCPRPALRQVDIVINKESCIRAFQYHFITPIQRHLKASARGKKPVTSEEEETCPICLEALFAEGQRVRVLAQCKHKFHDLCISKAVESKPRCPLCMSPLGVQQGDQPPGGRMAHAVLFTPLPGYPRVGTIRIQYDIPGGVQTGAHPSPGTPYPPTSRTAYLPDNQQGQKVLALLETAFERGLVFTIGTSRTLGLDNVITWNDIHHKTRQTGPEHGYPDTGYLERVIAELKDKGVE